MPVKKSAQWFPSYTSRDTDGSASSKETLSYCPPVFRYVETSQELFHRSLLQKFVADSVRLMRPRAVYICDGSQLEFEDMLSKLQQRGVLRSLDACPGSYVVRTDPRDTQRVESKTFVVTSQMHSTASGWTVENVKSDFANWMSAADMKENIDGRFPACMRGRMMYVIPFSMGPIGGYYSKYAVQLTDSPYVVASMRIMTRFFGGRAVVIAALDALESIQLSGTQSVSRTPLCVAFTPLDVLDQ